LQFTDNYQGNEAFKLRDYPAAIGHYTAAIIADRTDATFPLNRAAAYLKLGKYVGIARTDDMVLFLNVCRVDTRTLRFKRKALFRRGQVMVGSDRLSDAQKGESVVPLVRLFSPLMVL